jgi:hypothetical protein
MTETGDIAGGPEDTEPEPGQEPEPGLSEATLAPFRDLITAAALAEDPDAAWERLVARCAREILAVTPEYRRAFLAGLRAGLRAAGYPVPERKPPDEATWAGGEWSAEPEYELDPGDAP